MKWVQFPALGLALLFCSLAVQGFADECWHCSPHIAVAVVADQRGSLEILSDGIHVCRPRYPRWDGYVEAVQNERYSIRVTNSSHQWVGLVVAVDGRNIVSGSPSSLSSGEGMYVLKPHSSASFSGWRASLQQVNRFYFTDQHDSYAGRSGDFSEMGTIKVAAFGSRRHFAPSRWLSEQEYDQNKAPMGSAKAGREERAYSQANPPGTGYGEGQYSPVERIDFDPESSPLMTWSIRYRWQEQRFRPFPPDRPWFPRDEIPQEFAPPPPR
jgi:hypothetical protein